MSVIEHARVSLGPRCSINSRVLPWPASTLDLDADSPDMRHVCAKVTGAESFKSRSQSSKQNL